MLPRARPPDDFSSDVVAVATAVNFSKVFKQADILACQRVWLAKWLPGVWHQPWLMNYSWDIMVERSNSLSKGVLWSPKKHWHVHLYIHTNIQVSEGHSSGTRSQRNRDGWIFLKAQWNLKEHKHLSYHRRQCRICMRYSAKNIKNQILGVRHPKHAN